MYDAGPPARVGAATVITWLVAGVLVLGAILGTAWLFAQDGLKQPGAAGSVPSESPADPTAQESAGATASPAAGGEQESGASPEPAPEPAVATLVGSGSGRCLDVPDGNFADGVPMQIFDCNGSTAQQWTVTAAGELRVGGTKCLDDPSGGANRTTVVIKECHGGAEQQWSTPGDGTVRNVGTGLCLDVDSEATANGSRVAVYQCHLGSNQLWSFDQA